MKALMVTAITVVALGFIGSSLASASNRCASNYPFSSNWTNPFPLKKCH